MDAECNEIFYAKGKNINETGRGEGREPIIPVREQSIVLLLARINRYSASTYKKSTDGEGFFKT
jgi:hypothetical protein